MDLRLYMEKVEEIRKKQLFSKNDVARFMGISMVTLARLYDETNNRPPSFKTLRAVRSFVEKFGE